MYITVIRMPEKEILNNGHRNLFPGQYGWIIAQDYSNEDEGWIDIQFPYEMGDEFGRICNQQRVHISTVEFVGVYPD